MPYSFLRAFTLLFAISVTVGCTAWQPTKEVWKTTKSLWNTYVSPPAEVDYDDKGGVNPEAYALSTALIGIDAELGKLERTMQNADRPPTQEWLGNLFASFPWLNGFAGVKYDGTILGQEPPDSMKKLDFIPLLYEDKKQGSRALRADVQPGPLGPEVMLATPLYDGVDFLGIVVAYFDMRSLMRFSNTANEIVVLCPGALLWPGKYDFAATPLAGVQWEKVVLESTSGTCTNVNGTFYYMVRYLGNMPMIFAIAAEGKFPEGTGALDQGNPYFPQEREKLPPPPMPERKRSTNALGPAFEKPEPEPEPEPTPAPPAPQASDRNVIQQGSRESMLLKQRHARQRQIQERQLDGENVPYQPRRSRQPEPQGPTLDLIPDTDAPTLPGGRPSPFGPKGDSKPARPSPFGPTPAEPGSTDAQQGSQTSEAAKSTEDTAPRLADGEKEAVPEQPAPAPKAAPAPETPAQDTASGQADGEKEASPATTRTEAPKPATLPGGRPSPFGPRN